VGHPFAVIRVLVLGAHAGALQFFLRRFPASGDYLVARRFREAHDGAKGSNQAICAARLGASTTLLSAVGDDERGRAALGYMRREGMNIEHVLIGREQPTGFGAGFYLEDGSVMGATYVGATTEITCGYLENQAGAFTGGQRLFLASLELPADVALYGLQLARRAGIPLTVLNPSPADDLPRLPLPDMYVLTPNEPEARLLAGLAPDGDEPYPDVAEALAAVFRVPLIVMTLGEQGCYVHGRGISRHYSCPKVRAVDTSGAGDCFNASLALGLAGGWDLERAVQFALHAATLSVTRSDSWPAYPTVDEVEEFIETGRT